MVTVEMSMAAWDGIMIKKEAYDAFTELFRDAEAQGFTLAVCSGYRSYEYQQELFENALATQSEAEAHMFSAYPGRSEHHTGLCVDLVEVGKQHRELSESFEDTPAFEWLSKNAHKYGFILRYPKDKTNVTKYSYEPWHYRFVGLYASEIIYEDGITLEEFLGKTN
jgi:D-alanyl-D-alanine carboxypeptidase